MLIVEHSLLLSTFLAVSLVALSLTLGTCFGMRIRLKRHKLSIDTSEASDIKQCPSSPDAEQARELLVHFHDVATSVAGDVHEHTAAIQASSKELVTLSENEDDSATGNFVHVIEGILEANQRLERQLEEKAQEIEKQARFSESLLHDALTDALTQIPNRRAFDQEIERRFAEFKRYQTPVSMLLVDVDKFKPFNDLHGHQAGDFVLHGVASVLAESLREMDLPARYGGEEFAAILPRTDLRVSKRIAERVRTAIQAAAFGFEGNHLQVTASVGLAELTAGEDIKSFINRADAALYASKNAGRNRTYFHSGQLCEPVSSSDGTLVVKPASEGKTETTETASEKSVSGSVEEAEPRDARKSHDVDPRTDAVSGLMNREAFSEEVRRKTAEWRRYQTPLSLMVMSIDQLAELNERHGSFAGDLTAKLVLQFLRAATRETDIKASLGDGQFAVLLVHTNLRSAVTNCERIRRAIATCELPRIEGEILRFTVSMGVVEVFDEDGSVSLLRRAEAARLAAGNAGGNVTFANDGKSCRAVDVSSDVASSA